MTLLEQHACFGGSQQVWQHAAKTVQCDMRFAIFLPEQAQSQPLPVLYWLSGLTCNEQNVITKAGAQRYAAEHGVILVAPDTSPRGDNVADDQTYDLGQGAGFYVNATQTPWVNHYQMYDYVLHELHDLVCKQFNALDKRSIFGHSMGGHGALVLALRNPQAFVSVSAFAPIVAPSQVAWGEKAFAAYLGDDKQQWIEYDAVALIEAGAKVDGLLVDQGLADNFLDTQLKTELLARACQQQGIDHSIRLQQGYDHSYYFIATFMGEHIAYHAQRLKV
ncbi:S-formylglutathione hydrolase [Pseudomonas sp. F1_0610]|uniref:S-formylglutathione hydrolase n=1 Tax=Pseudomonas sp. F1_0610 TaxID=3114284 RepID=UPI0039C3A426